MADYSQIPGDLPVPVDDGKSDHLPGLALPALAFGSTDGRAIRLDTVSPGRWLLFIYPMTGVPDVVLPTGWNDIPGARGCTPEACGFRDSIDDLRRAGVEAVFGLSSQETDYQNEAVARLELPYALLSDPDFELGEALGLPRFEADGRTYYARISLVVDHGHITKAFYPIFPPNEHARRVVEWIASHPAQDAGVLR